MKCGGIDPCFTTFRQFLTVLAQTPVGREPGTCALHYVSAALPTISNRQPRAHWSGDVADILGAIPVLDIGRQHLGSDHQSLGSDEHVARAALSLLVRVVAATEHGPPAWQVGVVGAPYRPRVRPGHACPRAVVLQGSSAHPTPVLRRQLCRRTAPPAAALGGVSVAHASEPLVAVFVEEDGQEVGRDFPEERADVTLSDDTLRAALAAIGSCEDLDWENWSKELDRIWHESEPAPPIEL
jgi:hypothetical protein